MRNCSEGPEADMKHLELLDKAASSISDGDMVDTMIHQYASVLFCSATAFDLFSTLTLVMCRQMQWSLMPLHAIHSTVKPAYLLYGKGLGYGSRDGGVTFPRYVYSLM